MFNFCFSIILYSPFTVPPGDSGIHLTSSDLEFSALRQRGHVLDTNSSDFGVSQFIFVDPDTKIISGMADPRKNGRATAATMEVT
jgi:gamma-glutamyltranspeptidase